MSWHYYNNDREKIGPFTSKELKQFVQQGIITPETFVEDPNGRTGLAKDVKGFRFPETVQSEPASPVSTQKPPKPPWYYFNEDGERIEVTTRQLKQLVRQGVVTTDTRVEDPNGNTALAKIVTGLPFPVPEKEDAPVVAPNSIPALLKKAEAGDPGAMLELAYAYNKIENFSPEDVFFWIEKAAKLGNAQAQFELSDIYRSEDTPLYDLEESLHWLVQSAQNGYTIAKHNLATCYLAGTGVAQDNKKALHWMEQAANEGHAGAKRKLGLFYIEGIGVSVDQRKGRSLLQEAVSLGDEVAKEFLGTAAPLAAAPTPNQLPSDSPATSPVSSQMFSGDVSQSVSQFVSAGVQSMTATKNKWVAAFLAFYFGPFGAHKFYLEGKEAGMKRLLTFGGSALSWFEAFQLITMPGKEFAAKYNNTSGDVPSAESSPYSPDSPTYIPPVHQRTHQATRGGWGCSHHPSQQAVSHCRMCGNGLCQDCYDVYGVSLGEFAGQALCYDCTAELVAENVANVAIFRETVQKERSLIKTGFKIGFVGGMILILMLSLGAFGESVSSGFQGGFFGGIGAIIAGILFLIFGVPTFGAILGASIGGFFGSFGTIMKSVFSIGGHIGHFIGTVAAAFAERDKEGAYGLGCLASWITIFVCSPYIIGALFVAGPFVTLYRWRNRNSQIERLEGIIQSDSRVLQEMRDYFAYTQTLEQNKGVDLDTLTSQGGVLFDNSYAKAVRSRGEQAAQAGLRERANQFAANGEIIRSVINTA